VTIICYLLWIYYYLRKLVLIIQCQWSRGSSWCEEEPTCDSLQPAIKRASHRFYW